jgi:hypothetical protein
MVFYTKECRKESVTYQGRFQIPNAAGGYSDVQVPRKIFSLNSCPTSGVVSSDIRVYGIFRSQTFVSLSRPENTRNTQLFSVLRIRIHVKPTSRKPEPRTDGSETLFIYSSHTHFTFFLAHFDIFYFPLSLCLHACEANPLKKRAASILRSVLTRPFCWSCTVK